MERIMIIGCPGSGKSTLARELGDRLELPVIHLDRLWWTAGWQNVSQEEFDARLENALKLDRWIIDGNFSRTVEARLEKCDTVIYLDFGRWACLRGMLRRVITNYGKVRPDMPGGCPERFDLEFVKFIWNFNRQNRVRNYTWIAKSKHAKAIVLKNRREVKAFLREI